jgi:acylphosphatase
MATKHPNEADTARVHVHVEGRVQGIGFRAYVQQAGAMLDLTGWVRNVGYDKVETVAEGPRAKVEEFVEAVRTGPRGSRVAEIKVEWEMVLNEFDRFEVRSSR